MLETACSVLGLFNLAFIALFQRYKNNLSVVIDLKLLMTYSLVTGHMDKYWVTLGCVVFPALVMMLMDLSWIYIDFKAARSQTQQTNQTMQTRWTVLHCLLTLISLGILGRLYRYPFYVCCC